MLWASGRETTTIWVAKKSCRERMNSELIFEDHINFQRRKK
jgi:hypothetical protein